MITKLKAQQFTAVPYLETSSLMLHNKELVFSTTKPNVIVGQNGAGKSALLKALGLYTMSFYMGHSSLDEKYLDRKLWSTQCGWRNEYEFLKGLVIESDMAPALFYKPNTFPGDDVSVSHSMVCGYFAEAREYAKRTEHKSSGQKSSEILSDVIKMLTTPHELAYGLANWRYGRESIEVDRRVYTGDYQFKSEILKARATHRCNVVPTVLLDEPEQSLDTLSEAKLWKLFASMDCTKSQLIVSTHSTYPFLHQEKFHLIEATPNYVEQVQNLLAWEES